MTTRSHAWVAEVGGTWIRSAVVDTFGRVVAQQDIPTQQIAGPSEALAVLTEIWQEQDGEQSAGVALSLAAQINADGTTGVAPNLPAWRGVRIRELLRESFGDQAQLMFDAHAALLGEQTFGTSTTQNCLMLIIGTGVGGAFLVDGHLAIGANTVAGHPGMHVPGTGDSIEAIASGNALARTLGVSDGRAALELARAGDTTALKAFARAAEALDWVLTVTTAVIDADRVVIGGGFGLAAFDLLFPTGRLAESHYPAIHDKVTICRATTGADAGKLGLAARLFQTQTGQ